MVLGGSLTVKDCSWQSERDIQAQAAFLLRIQGQLPG